MISSIAYDCCLKCWAELHNQDGEEGKMSHDELVNRAKQAIDIVFSDRSVSREQTRESLEEIEDELQTLIGMVTD